MSQAFTGEIRMFGGTYAPHQWTLCYGQMLAIAQYASLFSLIGTYYGGDGRSSFGIPDMRGRIPIHNGTGPGLTPRVVGQMFGQESVVLTTAQIPSHTHTMQASSSAGNSVSPVGNVMANVEAAGGLSFKNLATGETTNGAMAAGQVGSTGSNQGHPNRMPTLCVNFIMCLQGLYPSRN